jgi:hypothetical protein
MKGTAILFSTDQTVTIFEDVDKEELNEICQSENQDSHTSSIFWHDEDVDWEYGY